MRQRVALFKDQRYDAAAVAAARLSAMTDDDDEDDVPEVRCRKGRGVSQRLSVSALQIRGFRIFSLGTAAIPSLLEAVSFESPHFPSVTPVYVLLVMSRPLTRVAGGGAQVPLEELLDDLMALSLGQQPADEEEAAAAAGGQDGQDSEMDEA